MFSKRASVAEEVYSSFEKNYEDQKTLEVREAQAKFARAVDSLVKAADLLDDVGLDVYADEVSEILETVAWHVPTNDAATSGLTPEKMEKNLAEKGWVFNADDGEVLEVVETTSEEVPQLSDTDGTIEVESEPSEEADAEKADADDSEKTSLASDEHQPEWLSVLQDSEDEEFLDPEGLGLAADNETDQTHKMRMGPDNWKSISEMSDDELIDHSDAILRSEERAHIDLDELSDEEQLSEFGEPEDAEDKMVEKVRRMREEEAGGWGIDWEDRKGPMRMFQ